MDGCVYAWAKSFVGSSPVLEKKRLSDLDSYVNKIGNHISMYHDEDTGHTMMCVFDVIDQKLYWNEITNFDQIMEEHEELVKLWIRNGECLCTYIGRGKGLNVVNLSLLKK